MAFEQPECYQGNAYNQVKGRHRKKRKNNKAFTSDIERDFFAMNQVWKMLKEGAVRWIGEIGRQY